MRWKDVELLSALMIRDRVSARCCVASVVNVEGWVVWSLGIIGYVAQCGKDEVTFKATCLECRILTQCRVLT